MDAQIKVSFIIPTLNAAALLGRCLRSIRNQDCPLREIIVADGGSKDQTLSIARSFGAVVVDNPKRIAEQGKQIALAMARGEFVIFMDADNELSSPDFASLAVQALEDHPKALGVESYYPAAPDMGSFCAYLTATLHISDPVSWMMSVRPVLKSSQGEVECWTFPPGSLAYPLGANGFVYRRSDLAAAHAAAQFEDTEVALRLAKAGRTEWLRLRGRGVHHYVVKGLWDFTRKRRRQAYHFMSLRHPARLSWTRERPRVPGWIACLYCATLLGPVYHAVVGCARDRDARWCWHPVAGVASVVGVAWGVVTYLLSPRTADAEASLQPVSREGR